MNFNKDMLLIDAFNKCSEEQKAKLADVLAGYGMHCLGCALAHGETFEQACNAHGEDVTKMMTEINAIN